MNASQSKALLVLPRLRVQNANAISSPLTHGFPSITAFMGLMWALQRKLVLADIPLQLHGVGVICHHHQEQVTQGYLQTFNLTRNPVDKDGSTAAIVEEGRIHLEVTLVFSVSEKRQLDSESLLIQDNQALLDTWAEQAGQIVSQMRVAGGTLIPASRRLPGKRVTPWLSVLADDATESAKQFREWRRQWLPGFALVGRDDLLAARLDHLRQTNPDATLLDAWLHASRFNHESSTADNGRVQWGDPLRPKGSGWIVPIPVGYAALTQCHTAGSVLNARDMGTPLRFVESVYSMGEWISPHRLSHLQELLWHAETDESRGLYRCRNAYQPPAPTATESAEEDAAQSEDKDEDEDVYIYD